MKRSNLRENYIEKHPGEDLKGKQAHHIIPVEFLCELYNCEESELSEELLCYFYFELKRIFC